jgi:hypothetical protein
MSSTQGIKVAVRVRPFSQEEQQRGEGSIIKVTNKTTTISNPDCFLSDYERTASVSKTTLFTHGIPTMRQCDTSGAPVFV